MGTEWAQFWAQPPIGVDPYGEIISASYTCSLMIFSSQSDFSSLNSSAAGEAEGDLEPVKTNAEPEKEPEGQGRSKNRPAGRGAQALLVLTEWDEFRQLDLARLRDLMDVPILLDGRNVYEPDLVRSAGFEYISVGR